MEQLHGRARLTHKYIHITISRLQTHFPDLPTHTIHSHAHICRMLRHNYTVVLIQIEHNCFGGTKVNSINEMEKAACLGWFRYFFFAKNDTYTNEKSLSHCRDQGSS